MKTMNQIKQILDMGVHHDKERNTIYITQSMDERAKYSKQQMPEAGSAEALQVATYPYRKRIGTLLLISNGTRPVIVYAVNTLAKFTCNPGIVHGRAALRVLGYLNGTKHYCIRYEQQTVH